MFRVLFCKFLYETPLGHIKENKVKRFISICLFVLAFIAAQTNNLKITVLSTMVADYDYIGEWGFAALVEVDGNQILFDTGFRENTVLENADSLNIDLSKVEHVFLSHNHMDHAGGLIPVSYTHLTLPTKRIV